VGNRLLDGGEAREEVRSDANVGLRLLLLVLLMVLLDLFIVHEAKTAQQMPTGALLRNQQDVHDQNSHRTQQHQPNHGGLHLHDGRLKSVCAMCNVSVGGDSKVQKEPSVVSHQLLLALVPVTASWSRR
jgi:hypothetical protein